MLADALFRLGDMGKCKRHGFLRTVQGGTGSASARSPRLLNGTGIGAARQENRPWTRPKRIVAQLDDSVLAIQGPPGAGKTFTGARMICELVRQGKKVGITATSHKVIRKLLDDVIEAAQELQSQAGCDACRR